MRRKRKLIISVLILVFVAIAAGCAYLYHAISTVVNVDTICEGIRIDGCEVGGLTREDANGSTAARRKACTNED